MFGIPGMTLGAILRSKGYNYGEISVVALVYTMAVLLISVIALLLGASASAFMTWIPETMVLVLAAFLIGVSSFVALMLGAVVFDAAEYIIKRVK